MLKPGSETLCCLIVASVAPAIIFCSDARVTSLMTIVVMANKRRNKQH
jgi:hypothetical protein